MDENIKFEVKQEKDLLSLMIYRAYNREDKKTRWCYIDSCHPMTKIELHTLKNFLQEYLHNNDWD
jgi:hypothetical protein